MEHTRFAYNGTPDEYAKYIRQVFFRFQTHFEDIWKAMGQLKIQRVKKEKMDSIRRGIFDNTSGEFSIGSFLPIKI